MKSGILRATKLATLLKVTPKTIHNWCVATPRRKTPLPHWRTLGGHLRFDPRAVLSWARIVGQPIPDALLAICGEPPAPAPAPPAPCGLCGLGGMPRFYAAQLLCAQVAVTIGEVSLGLAELREAMRPQRRPGHLEAPAAAAPVARAA